MQKIIKVFGIFAVSMLMLTAFGTIIPEMTVKAEGQEPYIIWGYVSLMAEGGSFGEKGTSMIEKGESMIGEYTPWYVPNAIVNVTNYRTNETQIIFTTETGYYSVDLATFPSGYNDGDWIRIYARDEYGNDGYNYTEVNTTDGNMMEVDVIMSPQRSSWGEIADGETLVRTGWWGGREANAWATVWFGSPDAWTAPPVTRSNPLYWQWQYTFSDQSYIYGGSHRYKLHIYIVDSTTGQTIRYLGYSSMWIETGGGYRGSGSDFVWTANYYLKPGTYTIRLTMTAEVINGWYAENTKYIRYTVV